MLVHVAAGRVIGRSVAMAGALLVAGSCNMATLPDQGPVHPASLVFSTQPEYAIAGAPLQPGVAVTVMESNGDTAYYATATIQLSIASGYGKPAAHLLGVTQVTAVNGTAVFPDVAIDSAGIGYRLLASALTLGGAASDSFDVTAGAPVRLAFIRQPVSTAASDTLPAVAVAVEDALGNAPPFAADSVTLVLAAGSDSGVLGGTAIRRADSGLATFADLSVSAAGTGYVLVATARGFAPDTSARFNITAGVPPTPGAGRPH
jgi:hypothetical protein